MSNSILRYTTFFLQLQGSGRRDRLSRNSSTKQHDKQVPQLHATAGASGRASRDFSPAEFMKPPQGGL